MFQELKNCQVCPFLCGVDRSSEKLGICKCNDKVKISLASLHYFEEPCISGENGSGTIFFTGCNLKCIYCQNYEISHKQKGKEIIPTTAQALSLNLKPGEYPHVELPLEQALRYLHREAFALPAGTPRGFVVVTYQKQPLGFMKNLGDRANNLYPKNWAIKKL